MRRGLWADSDFLKLWAGQSVSQMGSWVTLIAIPLTAVLLLKASPIQMGILSGSGAAVVLAGGLFAGAWVDRLRRRPLLIASDIARAAVLASVPAAVALHRLSMLQLYVVAMSTAVLTVLFDVSYEAYLPSLVEPANILEGNSKMALSRSIAEVAGPGLAGVLVSWFTAPVATAFDALSFLLSAASLAVIRKPEAPPAPQHSPDMRREIAEGLRGAWREPVLRAILLRTAGASIFLGVPSALYFLFALRELRLSPALLSAVIAVGGASNLLGSLLAGRVIRRLGAGRTLIASALITGVAGLLVPLARGPVAACAAILALSQLGDLAWSLYNIGELTLRQSIAPAHLLGRINAASHLLFRGFLPLGALAGGAIAQAIGVRGALFLSAAGFLLSSLWLVFSPVRGLRELRAAVVAG